MSIKHGGGADSGASPAEPAVAEPDPATPHSAGAHSAGATTADPAVDVAPPAEPDPDATSGPDADREGAAGAGPDPDGPILAAGGTVVGESEVTGLADRSRVRRAPRYKRFVVFGALVGLLVSAVAALLADYTPVAAEQSGVSPWGLFLLLVTILVPFLILVSCAVAMLTDRAARVPPRTKRTGKGRR
ncbi:hypothetical protein [Ruania zhangjianzhongii]|uniref:hypothetical protein n=1 Tax=Ruania zhangjianzhongii TaxID=2603206 RepID=UPI0011C74BC0|nr:hypothetical protein [Ruania zhangjianzhongii]